jgi:replication factor A1
MIIVDAENMTPFNTNVPKIGQPVNINEDKAQTTPPQTPQVQSNAPQQQPPQPQPTQPAQPAQFYQAPSNQTPARQAPTFNQQPQQEQDMSQQQICKIASLSPYNPKWTIAARVLSKTDIRTWKKERTEGKLFSVNLCDESGEIKATAFNDAATRWHDFLIVGQVCCYFHHIDPVGLLYFKSCYQTR